MKKWTKNPWLILGGAFAVYWFWLRPKAAPSVAQTISAEDQALAAQQAQQARVNAAIAQVTDVVPGETQEEWEQRQQAYSQATGQIMPTMMI